MTLPPQILNVSTSVVPGFGWALKPRLKTRNRKGRSLERSPNRVTTLLARGWDTKGLAVIHTPHHPQRRGGQRLWRNRQQGASWPNVERSVRMQSLHSLTSICPTVATRRDTATTRDHLARPVQGTAPWRVRNIFATQSLVQLSRRDRKARMPHR